MNHILRIAAWHDITGANVWLVSSLETLGGLAHDEIPLANIDWNEADSYTCVGNHRFHQGYYGCHPSNRRHCS